MLRPGSHTSTNNQKLKTFASANRRVRLAYCAPYFWKKIFFYQSHFAFKMEDRFIFSRSSTIPRTLVGCIVKIYSGRRWYERLITRWLVGFKFGEFTWNRRPAVYKAKQLRKKKKKK